MTEQGPGPQDLVSVTPPVLQGYAAVCVCEKIQTPGAAVSSSAGELGDCGILSGRKI